MALRKETVLVREKDSPMEHCSEKKLEAWSSLDFPMVHVSLGPACRCRTHHRRNHSSYHIGLLSSMIQTQSSRNSRLLASSSRKHKSGGKWRSLSPRQRRTGSENQT
jgi:hypothetical protein